MPGLNRQRGSTPALLRRLFRVCFLILSAVICSPVVANAAIHAGDHLEVHVYNHPELTKVTIVNSAGAIEMPLTGTVHVEGLQSGEVAMVIHQRLVRYIPYPDVDVQDIDETQTLFIAGGPGGVIPYSPGEHLASAVAEISRIVLQSGHPESPNSALTTFDRSRIDLKQVAVFRDAILLGTYDMIALRTTGNPGPYLHANDTLSFPDKPIEVRILGSVNAPGSAYLWPDEPLSDAIDQVGGLTPTAATGRVTLTRTGEEPRVIALGNPLLARPARIGDMILIATAPRVTVAGLVAKPGPVTLTSDFSLLSAISAAGGINKFANIKNVQVLRDGSSMHYDIVALTHGDASQNPMLEDGDTVFVPEGNKVDWSAAFGALGALGSVLYRI